MIADIQVGQQIAPQSLRPSTEQWYLFGAVICVDRQQFYWLVLCQSVADAVCSAVNEVLVRGLPCETEDVTDVWCFGSVDAIQNSGLPHYWLKDQHLRGKQCLNEMDASGKPIVFQTTIEHDNTEIDRCT